MTRSRGGYTLVELIVAMGLFALVMLLASGAYIMMIGANRQAQAISTGIDNLSFALESMTRNIRTGTSYDCGSPNNNNGQATNSCPSGSSIFSFTDQSLNTVSYMLSNASIQRSTDGGQTWVQLTDPSVKISSLMFYAYYTDSTSGKQPRVTIVISGSVSSGPGKTDSFTVETGATMRGVNIGTGG